jgi:hypothetical protein
MDSQSSSPKSAKIEKEKRKNAFALGSLQKTKIKTLAKRSLRALFR